MRVCVCACALFALTSGTLRPALQNRLKNNLSNPFEDAILKYKIEMNSGYVPVRSGVSIFWWLFYADGRRAGSSDKPMLVWVQGGPGLPASGVGNFMEIGPLDLNFNRRNYSWTNGHNVLFVDSPAGTGFSKFSNQTKLSNRDKRVVTDFVNTLYGFMRAHPEYNSTSWHIFSQSYGGKLAPKIGYRLHKAIKRGRVSMNLRTVGIGSGFVDPVESISSAADYLYHMGLLDYGDYEKFKKSTASITSFIKSNRLDEAFLVNMQKYDNIAHVTQYNKNNINKENNMDWYYDMETKLNAYVKPALHSTRDVELEWESLPSNVYLALSSNMMLSSKRYVERLLNESSIKIVVYNGNFDAVTPMAGCVNWVHSLRWNGSEAFKSTTRGQIPGKRAGYFKTHGALSLWWVLSAGHWVPNDNPAAMQRILEYATNN